jgi:hypothetical protein
MLTVSRLPQFVGNPDKPLTSAAAICHAAICQRSTVMTIAPAVGLAASSVLARLESQSELAKYINLLYRIASPLLG